MYIRCASREGGKAEGWRLLDSATCACPLGGSSLRQADVRPHDGCDPCLHRAAASRRSTSHASPQTPLPCSALFERATHLQLPPKKMKFLFKRYLDYERQYGTAAGAEHVKRRAMEYVEAQAAA